MQRGERQRKNGVGEKWSSGISNNPRLQHSNTPMAPPRRIQHRARLKSAFALYEVLLGVAIFAIGVIALGRAVEICLNASTISAEDGAVRQILSDRKAVVQPAPCAPDPEQDFKLRSSHGM